MKRILKATAVILNTSKPEKVVLNVKSILHQKTDFEVQIIVVDNSASSKNKEILSSLESEKNVSVLYSDNEGYAAGNNLGVKNAEGEILFIINPDIICKNTDVLQKMADFLQNNSDVGILGPRQRNPDGSYEFTARHFPTLFAQIFRRTVLKNIWPFSLSVKKYEWKDIDTNKVQDVDWIQSSFWAVPHAHWNELGGFDSNYFVFMADIEMCLQTRKKKKKIVYFPLVEVEADGIRCSEGGIIDIFTKNIIRIHATDALRYYWKRLW